MSNSYWISLRAQYQDPTIQRDHLSLLDSFQQGQPLSKMHILFSILLDPLLLNQQNHNIILLACRFICRLPLYAIRWMTKGLFTSQPIINFDNPLYFPNFHYDEPSFVDTYPNHICIPMQSRSWSFSFEDFKLHGTLDSEIEFSIPRPDIIEDFSMILTTLQHFLTTYACDNQQFEPVEDVILVMAMLYEINLKFKLIRNTLFYNEIISDTMDIKHHFPKWKLHDGFSICNYPFLMTPSSKADVLRIESMVQMRHELQDAFFRAMFSGLNSPYFTLEVRRDHLIRDSLYQIECKHPSDLKKQLRVSFAGEEAIDEGGPQKEFYRLIIRDMFKEDYGLFRYFLESRLWWFALDSLVDDACLNEYKLVGELIGIAIYNGIYLELNFPLALYKKMMNQPLDLQDLALLDPVLANSLKSILEMDDASDLGLSFDIEIPSYGHVHYSELCLNGKNKLVNNSNRQGKRD